MKKILTTLLVLVIIAANISFAACNNGSGGAGSSNTPPPVDGTPAESGDQGGETEKPADEDPYDKTAKANESLNVDLDALDYGNKKLTVYHSTMTHPEFGVDESEAQAGGLSEAVYKRNEYTEKNLGIKLEYIGKNGLTGDKSPFMYDLKVTVNDPDSPVGIIAAYSRTAPFLHITGLMEELTAHGDVLKLDKAWWPGNTCSENEIKGKIYYVTGDISPSLLKSMNVVFVNKKLANELGRNENNSLIELVKNGHWTIDELMTLSKDLYLDLDNVDGKSDGDRYGMALHYEDATNALWTGMGYKFYDRSAQDDELYMLSEDYRAGEAFVNKIYEWWNTADVYVYNENFSSSSATADQVFESSGALFLCCQMDKLDPELCSDDFTLLPAPKLTSTQESYHTSVGYKFSLYSICSEYSDTELAAQVLQTMGFYGYHLTTPVIAEELFGGRSNMDADDEYMFELIRSNISLDSGKILELYSGERISYNLSLATYQSTWMSIANSQKIMASQLCAKSAGEDILNAIKENSK